MKRIIYLVTFLFFSAGAFAQLPQLISYQAVVRNSSNALVANTQVGVYVSIVKDSANGTVVYGELHTPTTNANGLFSIAIGTAVFTTGKFSAIDWSSGVYFIKSQIDLTGGLNFTITGTSQILSVPYALYAANGTQPGKNVGDLQYWDGSKWAILPAGANGSVLTMSNGKPSWGNASVAPTLTTTTPSSITPTTAVCGGNVTSDGGSTVTSYGICYSTTTITPTTANSTVAVGAGTGSFSTTVYGLTPSTTYYIRTYATNSVGTSYGALVAITTLVTQTSFPPTVTTTSPTSLNITSSDIALGGNITSIGSSSVTSYGLCYSTTTNPTTSNSTVLGVGSGTGSFLDTIRGLTSSTTYYTRAFATNSAGTSYGNQLTITTEALDLVGLPTVQVISFTPSANGTGGTAVAVVTYNGGSFVNNGLGFNWSTNSNPRSAPLGSASCNFINNTSDTFTTNISGLTAGTTYYLQAYASNGWQSAGYSNVLSFTTSRSTTTYKIGQSYGGGTIFYVDGTGQHGLIAANSDAGGMTPWDKSTSGTFPTTNATDTTIGAGAANTATIIATIGASGSYAALIASQTANGYSDWYLPSKGELDLVFNNLWTKSLGNFTANVYWSSSEGSTNQAWAQNFSSNVTSNYTQYTYWKSNSAYIRPIRKF